jgi:aminocarboxymuconate-semialdehyde decarboxylase
MTTNFTVDVHAHHYPAGLRNRAVETGDSRWPSLSIGDDASTGRIMCGAQVFRHVRAPLWDVPTRIRELDAAGVALQVLSPVPVMLTYWAEPGPAAAFAAEINDALARDIAGSDGRLAGLGTVALQSIDVAIDELTRLTKQLGLRGVQIGTQIDGRELDDLYLRPFFEAAESLGAAVFVHPMDGGGGAIRRGGQPYDFGLGMLTDTAMAATAVVFGGVLDNLPDLKVGFAHGCGTFPWAFPRLKMATQLVDHPDPAGLDELVRSVWADSLVFDPSHLALLLERFGEGHVMFGTDYPFVPGQIDGIGAFLDDAINSSGPLTDALANRIRGTNALDFIGIKPAALSPSLPCC